MGKENFNDFVQKVIRSRDYHIHANLENKNIYSDFELLYISLLLDFVVALGLMQSIGASQKTQDYVTSRGNSVFIDMQSVNKMLGQDSLKIKNNY
jgi:hypothetical protein